jgi:hypothetical protein
MLSKSQRDVCSDQPQPSRRTTGSSGSFAEENNYHNLKMSVMSLLIISIKVKHQFSWLPKLKLCSIPCPVAPPPVHRLNVVGMVVAPGPSHASWVRLTGTLLSAEVNWSKIVGNVRAKLSFNASREAT